MKKINRILEVFVQIGLLPVSVFITGTSGSYIWTIVISAIIEVNRNYFGDIYSNVAQGILAGAFMGLFYAAVITPLSYIGVMAIDRLKNTDSAPIMGGGESYTYEETVSHDIRLTDGTVIGSYDTTEIKEGYRLSFEEFGSIVRYLVICFFSLPCRIISLIASIIACFTDKFFVMARHPKLSEGQDYYHFLHRYFDIVIIKKKKQ